MLDSEFAFYYNENEIARPARHSKRTGLLRQYKRGGFQMIELEKIDTEQRNEQTMQIDSLSTFDMVSLINQEDHRVAEAESRSCPRWRGPSTRPTNGCARAGG